MNEWVGVVTLAALMAVVAAVIIRTVMIAGRESADNQKVAAEQNRALLEQLQRLDGRQVALEQALQQQQEQQARGYRDINDTLLRTLAQTSQMQQGQSDILSRRLSEISIQTEQSLGQMRTALETNIARMQADNTQKLEQMRQTVDEKLHVTLQTRLNESFTLVSERLEQVYKGLGEMQSLATGVGDLKRVLTNIKTRGIWGEIQLGTLLEQVLTAAQYERNVAVRPESGERVDFAIRLPGRDLQDTVWLPIDAKYPQESYQRLLDAADAGDGAALDLASRQLENDIKVQAKSISGKYIAPPHTTDFAVMFLPSEGLYAEVLRKTGLCESLQRDYRLIVAGPTTLAALLNSLQVGFQTLAIEQRSSEVWQLLGAVKTEFGRFADLMTKTQKKLQEAVNVMDQAARRTRVIQRKLRGVEQLEERQTALLLEQDSADWNEEDGSEVTVESDE